MKIIILVIHDKGGTVEDRDNNNRFLQEIRMNYDEFEYVVC